MKLGDVIRGYRLHREISLRECAKEIGIGAATLMRAEQHHALDAKTFLAILNWLTDGQPAEPVEECTRCHCQERTQKFVGDPRIAVSAREQQ